MNDLFLIIRLEATSLYELLVIWKNIRLTIGLEGDAKLTGNGFAPDVTWALNTLIPEWKAQIHLTLPPSELPPGTYPLVQERKLFYVVRKKVKYLLPDQPVLVEVVMADLAEF